MPRTFVSRGPSITAHRPPSTARQLQTKTYHFLSGFRPTRTGKPTMDPVESKHSIVLLILSIWFLAVLVRTAWVAEDAYITLRTVDNVLNGYGLRWNIDERVQSYTHPLWLLLLIPICAITKNALFGVLLLCFVATSGALYLLLLRVARSMAAAIVCIAILLMSKAFVDYSTSGLENPAIHLLLVAFFLLYCKPKQDPKTLFFMSLVAGLAILCRMDTALLFLPPIAVAFWKMRKPRAFAIVAAGLAPFAIWELFSLFYYGFLFPNTAYAKLNTGISAKELLVQGGVYFLNSLSMDPLTLVVTAAGLATPFLARQRRLMPIALGVFLYLLYIAKIGGDFMSGRFFTVPLLSSVLLLSQLEFNVGGSEWKVALAAIFALGLAGPFPTILSNSHYANDAVWTGEKKIDDSGVADERVFWFECAGLLRMRRGVTTPTCAWVQDGLQTAKEAGETQGLVKAIENIGFHGYFAGPKAHLVDKLALSDALLARLPIEKNDNWRIGHFRREVPAGYLESLHDGQNHFASPSLGAYYEKLSLVVRGALWDPKRWVEIWRLNTGAENFLLEKYKQGG
jgi:arabinofuranosyltransferase